VADLVMFADTKRAIAEDIAFLAAHPTKWRSSK
jgi:hypothetical protein